MDIKQITKVQLGGMTLAHFLLRQLLQGALQVQLTINGKIVEGYVHSLDFAVSTSRHAQVSICFPDPENVKETSYVKAAIYADGRAELLPEQPD